MAEKESEKKPTAAKKAAKPKTEAKKTKAVKAETMKADTSKKEAPKSKPTAAAKPKAAAEVTVTLKKSGIGKAKDQKATIKGLGFKRLNQTVTLKDTPSVRGMINKISHLVEVQ
ncbi:MAG: 50S ribosomal protein L30 [Proteobacteria bacterium]|nr:50S ribosomal protein L30 [Pseudomonadota bacterium]